MLRMLRLNEDDLISGLSAFAAMTGGRYPSSMDSEEVMKNDSSIRFSSVFLCSRVI